MQGYTFFKKEQKENEMENNFGQFLSEKRKQANLTQKQLGEMLYVSESTVSKWEKNKANPDISVIGELAKILNVSEHELISASEDKEERINKIKAKKWTNLVSAWEWAFIIGYLVAILTCFICNLAVDKTLSWFFIVLSGVLLGASFTTFPIFISKYKLLINSVLPLVFTLLLFGVCCIYTGGNWFFPATVPTLVGFIMVFLPIYIKVYNLPEIIKNNNTLFSIITDSVLIFLLLLFLEKSTSGEWFISFAVPTFLYALIIPFAFIVVHYLKINKLLKTGILTFIFAPFSVIAYFIVKNLISKVFNESIT